LIVKLLILTQVTLLFYDEVIIEIQMHLHEYDKIIVEVIVLWECEVVADIITVPIIVLLSIELIKFYYGINN